MDVNVSCGQAVMLHASGWQIILFGGHVTGELSKGRTFSHVLRSMLLQIRPGYFQNALAKNQPQHMSVVDAASVPCVRTFATKLVCSTCIIACQPIRVCVIEVTSSLLHELQIGSFLLCISGRITWQLYNNGTDE